jgi:hypothetical protein
MTETMANEIEKYQPRDLDDGAFSDTAIPDGEPIKWDDQHGWRTHDGGPVPSPLLVIKIDTLLRTFQPEYKEIRDKPLPDPELLNNAIPIEDWPIGLDDEPEGPWKLNYETTLLCTETGLVYVHRNSTWGARKAYKQLQTAVFNKRVLTQEKLFPRVGLGERPMPTKRGLKSRPHFEIIGYERLGGTKLAEPQAPLPPAGGTPSAGEIPPAGKKITPGKKTAAAGKTAATDNDKVLPW